MPKSYVGSKALDLHVVRPCRPPENEATLYAKTADISGVLTVVDVPEKVNVLYAKTADIPGVLKVIEVHEEVASLHAFL